MKNINIKIIAGVLIFVMAFGVKAQSSTSQDVAVVEVKGEESKKKVERKDNPRNYKHQAGRRAGVETANIVISDHSLRAEPNYKQQAGKSKVEKVPTVTVKE